MYRMACQRQLRVYIMSLYSCIMYSYNCQMKGYVLICASCLLFPLYGLTTSYSERAIQAAVNDLLQLMENPNRNDYSSGMPFLSRIRCSEGFQSAGNRDVCLETAERLGGFLCVLEDTEFYSIHLINVLIE